MPSVGLVTSLWEPVRLVDSRIPYGAENKQNTEEFQKQELRRAFNSYFIS